MNDWPLLRKYLDDRSEPAFEALVRRHVDMVYSVALRKVRDVHVAQDVTQAVFVLLARKAPQLSSGVVLGGWLYNTACLVAKRALRDQIRRQLHERDLAAMHPNTAPDDLWERLAPELDSAISSLGERDRNAIVLRYLQRCSFQQVADALGVSEDAAKKRVQRALDKLRDFLARRGVELTAAALSASVAANGLQAAPSTLATSAVTAGLTTSGAAGTVVAALVTGTMRDILIRRIQWSAALAGLVLFVGSVLIITTREPESRAARQGVMPARQTEPVETVSFATPDPAAIAALTTNSRAIALRIISAETGASIPGAEVRGVFYGPKYINVNLISDSDGFVRATRPDRKFEGMVFWVAAHGHVPLVVRFDRAEEPSLPSEYTVRLAKGRMVQGTVVDEEQRFVSGAKVRFQGEGIKWNSREYITFDHPLAEPVTDAQGRWLADFIPVDRTGLSGQLQHPDYAGTLFRGAAISDGSSPVLVIQKGGTVAGVVRDPGGEPVPNAKVELKDTSGWRDTRKVETDAQGVFELPRVAEGTFRLAATAEYYSSADQLLRLDGRTSTNLDFTIKPLGIAGDSILRGRVVDDSGRPVTDINVSLLGKQSGLNGIFWSSSVDGTGRFAWSRAPEHPVKLSFGGWEWDTRQIELAPGGTEHVVIVKPKPTIQISGTVSDQRTGEPVPRFKVIYGGAPVASELLGSPKMLGEGQDGKFAFQLRADAFWEKARDFKAVRVMFDADGYAGRIVSVENRTNNVAINVALEPGGDVSGEVRTLDGHPAVGAEVNLRGRGLGASMNKPGEFFTLGLPSHTKARTSDLGMFHLRLMPGAERLAVAHTDGWANVELSTLPGTPIWLQPWSRIEGVVRVGGRIWPKLKINVSTRNRNVPPEQCLLDLHTYTDAEGRFEFPKVPPGKMEVVLIHEGERLGVFSHSQVITVEPNATANVVVGGSGARIIGRVITHPQRSDIGWRRSTQHLQPKNRAPDSTISYDYGFFCKDDGSFVIEDVPPGEYTLSLQACARDDRADSAGNIMEKTLGHASRPVTVPSTLTNRGELNLGIIEINTQSAP